APNSTFSHLSIYHYRSAILATPAPLYNPHSRNVGAAPRFSPTRFIPPLRLPEYFVALMPPGFGAKTLYVGALWQSVLCNATPSVFHQRHIGRVLRSP